MSKAAAAAVACGAVMRVALFVFLSQPSTSLSLRARPEILSPFTDSKVLEESILRHGQASVLPPLLIAGARVVPYGLVLALCDMWSAYLLHTLSPVALYVFALSPLCVWSIASLSLAGFPTALTLAAVVAAKQQRAGTAMLCLGAAAYLDLYPILLAPALLNLLPSACRRSAAAALLAWLSCLLCLSWLITGGSWSFISATYGAMLRVNDLTPNMGIFWYCSTLIFPRFRGFFLSVFHLHILVYIAPLLARFGGRQPMLVVWAVLAIYTLFRSYPTYGELGVSLSLLASFVRELAPSRFPQLFLCVWVMTVSAVVACVMWHLWIYSGSGNANFYYFQSLIFSFTQSLLILQVLRAAKESNEEEEKKEKKK